MMDQGGWGGVFKSPSDHGHIKASSTMHEIEIRRKTTGLGGYQI